MTTRPGTKISGQICFIGDHFTWTVPGFAELLEADGAVLSPIFTMGTSMKACEWQLELTSVKFSPNKEYYVSCRLKSIKRIEGFVEITFLTDNHDENALFAFEKSKYFSLNFIQLHGSKFIPQDYCSHRNTYLTKPFKLSFLSTDFNYRVVEHCSSNDQPNDDSEVLDCENSSLRLRLEALNDFEKLLDNEDFSDFVIDVDGKKLHAHKCILALKSPVFARMFSNDMIEKQTNNVTIDDVSYEILREMLRFMYTGKVKEINKIVDDLFYVADKYQVEQLKNLCVERFIDNVNAENVIGYIQLAEKHSINKLLDESIEFIISNAKDIVNKPEFEKFSAEQPIICRIFKGMALKES